MASSASNLNTMQSEVASKISHNLMVTTVGDATTPPQPRHEASSMPMEASESTPNRPDWLPEGWKMEVITRRNGKTTGVKDKYYYDPVSYHRFRSKKEVEYFLQTGMIRRSTPRSETPTADKTSAQRFDFKNPPSKVSWVLNSCSKGLWTPFVNNEEQPDSTKRLWAATMEDICSNAYKSQGLVPRATEHDYFLSSPKCQRQDSTGMH